jgi:hypothetical protein
VESRSADFLLGLIADGKTDSPAQLMPVLEDSIANIALPMIQDELVISTSSLPFGQGSLHQARISVEHAGARKSRPFLYCAGLTFP